MCLKRKLEIKDYHDLDHLLDEMLENIGNTGECKIFCVNE